MTMELAASARSAIQADQTVTGATCHHRRPRRGPVTGTRPLPIKEGGLGLDEDVAMSIKAANARPRQDRGELRRMVGLSQP
jgi:hypothetical protein